MQKKDKSTGTSQQALSATLAQQAMRPPELPDPENANITDRIKMNEEEARKRKGRAKTIAGGAYEKPQTAKTIAMGG